MLLSAEVRWFWQADSSVLWPWFADSPFPPGGGGSRDDIYVCDPKQTELGLKSRGSKPGIEVKSLVEERAVQTLGSLRATTQIWTKVTSEVINLNDLPTITIHKQRWLRKFDIDGATPREIQLGVDENPTGGESRPVNGCNVELTVIIIDMAQQIWTTIGFEAFGSIDRVEVNLTSVIQLFDAKPLPNFIFVSAQSYPAWLAANAPRVAGTAT